MKSVVCFTGSRNVKSKGLAYVNQLKSQVESQEISFDILRPGDYQLAPVFDPSVFFTGNDPSDGTIGDDGTMIKQKLLDADFIIFSSPV